MNDARIYVIGHRNPDTDSICSALAYARLRQQQGLSGVQAARAGNINRQTEFVLRELDVPLPTLLLDVHPRVGDVVNRQVVTIPGEAPLSQALELFHRHGIRVLPVIDPERRPLGILFLKRLAERFLIPGREEDIRRVRTSPASIRRCLKAVPLHQVEEEVIADLDLYVGAMASETFGNKVAGLDPRRMILITGDREDIQRKVVELGARILIVTGNLAVSEEILALARANGVTILVTPYDSASSAWLTRLSTPVASLVSGEFPAIGLNERLDDLRLKLLHSPDPGVVVLDREGRIAAVATKSNLLASSPLKLILVDHNELSQAVDGADKVEILEVVDHHRLGNFHTETPIRFINQPLGSTCTLVATLYRQAGIEPDRQTAALMLAGLLSDTVILKSPTTTETDREICRWLAERCGRDPRDFGTRLFGAGSALSAYGSVRELVLSDFKEYRSDELSFGVGQVEVVSFHEFEEMREDIRAGLLALKAEKNLDVAGLLVTDIVQETSLMLAVGGAELAYALGYPQVGTDLYELKGVLSRKKQLVPHLLKVLR